MMSTVPPRVSMMSLCIAGSMSSSTQPMQDATGNAWDIAPVVLQDEFLIQPAHTLGQTRQVGDLEPCEPGPRDG